MTAVKITELSIENVKRVRAVALTPSETGLTVIGGKNGQGKTSVIDAIAWALGGDRMKPTMPEREGALTPPSLHVELSNGVIVERKGKNSALKVIDPSGRRAGQKLLDSFISAIALDLPRFLAGSPKEKAETLLQVIGVGDQLKKMDLETAGIFNQRREVGRIYDRKKKAAEEMPVYPNVPAEPVSMAEITAQYEAAMKTNRENDNLRQRAAFAEAAARTASDRVEAIMKQLEEARKDFGEKSDAARILRQQADETRDIDVSSFAEKSTELEELNAKIRTNAARQAAEVEAETLGREYSELTERLEAVRRARTDLLQHADLPLEGLTVEDGGLMYNGAPWDGMSGSDQLKVAAAIVRRLNPQCGFVLMDKLEQMDADTLRDFERWCEENGLQVIATRVSTGDECSVIIEDGMVKDQTEAVRTNAPPKFVKGVF